MTGAPGSCISLGWTSSDRRALLALGCAGAACLLAMALRRRVVLGEPIPVDAEKVARVRERIDPNRASAASLRRLPLVGPERARAIVRYRRCCASAPAFGGPEDLQRVPGIGAGVVRLAGPYLVFPERARPPAP